MSDTATRELARSIVEEVCNATLRTLADTFEEMGKSQPMIPADAVVQALRNCITEGWA